MNTRERDSAINDPISAHRLHSLTPAQVLAIDRALTALGPFGEVRIVKARGRVRFIETLESQDMLKISNEQGEA
jgi:hypothetical protein